MEVANNSFYGEYNDSVILNLSQLSAFINGDINICNNAYSDAEVEVFFQQAIAPYTFVYAMNGVSQASITTLDNPYYIKTKKVVFIHYYSFLMLVQVEAQVVLQ